MGSEILGVFKNLEYNLFFAFQMEFDLKQIYINLTQYT